MESPDLRTIVRGQGVDASDFGWWTPVINMTDSIPMGFEHGRAQLTYAWGVDNEVQRR